MLATTRATTLRVVKAHYFLAAGLAVLALTAVAAAGTLRMSGDNAGSASMAPRQTAGATAEREPTYTLYLVASQAWATAVQMENDLAADIRAREGDFGPADVVYVEVITDGASLDRVVRTLMDLNNIRLTAGLPEARLVDLRGLGR